MTSATQESPQNRGKQRLHHSWHAIVEHRGWIAAVTLLTMGAAALGARFLHPVYEGEASLRIEEGANKEINFSLGEFMPVGMGGIPGLGGSGKIQADIMLLRSRRISEAIVDSLDLHVSVLEPRTSRDRIIRVLDAPRTTREGSYLLRAREDGSYEVRGRWMTPNPGVDPVEIGEPFVLGGATLALSPAVQEEAPERIRIDLGRFREVVEGFQEKSLRVLRPDKDAPILSIRYRTHDPELAAAVPNTVFREFTDYKVEVNKSQGRSTMQFLRDQLTTYENQLREAEVALEQYRETAEVINPTAQSEEGIKQLVELQARRDALATEITSLQELLGRIREASTDGASDLSLYRQLVSFPAFVPNVAVQAIFESLIELENRRSELLVLRKPQNQDVAARTQRIGELELELYRIGNNYLRSLETQHESVSSILAQYGRKLETIPAREVEFRRRARQQELMEQVSMLLQTRLKEAEIKAAGEPGEVRIIDAAIVPEKPLYPRPIPTLAFSLILGLVVGVGGVLIRESLNPTVRSQEDIWDATAGTPVLGRIPILDPRTVRNGNGRLPHRLKWLKGASRPGLVTLTDPTGPFSDAYRSLIFNLTRAPQDPSLDLLMVASATAGSNSEISAANLAIAIAHNDMRVLLVDADLRAGGLHRLLDTGSHPGLSDLLAGVASLEEVIQEVETEDAAGPRISFLSAGETRTNPVRALRSQDAKELFNLLRGRYDMVIVHAPALDAAIDAELLGKSADATILVARAGVTGKEALHLASARLAQLGIPLLGVILSDANVSRRGRLNRLAYS